MGAHEDQEFTGFGRKGVSLKSAIQHGVSSNSYWKMSRTPVINQAISNVWLQEQGLQSVKDL
ncbi:integron/retron-type RNA-directed DNA polymerase [Candidatus Symbiobacter mobilis CR]|uniref:Integron/retron-type RNA-directed DNA polymerase n=1 Tax=Candidatus Symbiobacter mobilis CR TaxID=946483 RepID=U5NDC3_9BURK|nr:integron/retron-type RNA-directed DNA polymerase [Candidatus Symbiobacter mobilis CR]